jgi:uncharacterized spore protein YtfJ
MAKTDVTVMPAGSGAAEIEASGQTVQTMMGRFLSGASVHAAYGQPVKHGRNLIIPTAEVIGAMGFGFGAGGAESSEGESRPAGAGGGGGGGGYILTRPVAAIVMGPDHVHQEPLVDVTKIALAVFTAAGLVGTLLIRMLRERRR